MRRSNRIGPGIPLVLTFLLLAPSIALARIQQCTGPRLFGLLELGVIGAIGIGRSRR